MPLSFRSGCLALSIALLPLSLPSQARSIVVRAMDPGPKATVQSYLQEALDRDPSLTDAEIMEIKARFRLLREKNRVNGLPVAAVMRPSFGSAAFAVAEQPGIEHENNDSLGYADPVNGSIDGELDSATDVDVFKVEMPMEGRLQLAVQPSGSSPMTDPALLVTDAVGNFVLYDDDSATLFPSLDDPVPSGTYYAHVMGVNGDQGTYKLVAGSVPGAFQMLTPGQTANSSFSSALRAFTFVVAADSKVDMTVDGGSLDPFAVILNSRGAVHAYIDDSTVGGLDPAFDSYLPPGTYHVLIGEYFDRSGGFSLRIDLTPMAIPQVSIGGTATASAAGYESMPMYKLVLAQNRVVHFQSAPDPMDPLADPAFTLYDRNLAEIFFQDDDRGSLYSNLQVPLPAGTYYLSWISYDGVPGSLGVFTSTSLTNPTAANPGLNSGLLPSGPGTALFTLETRTADFVEVSTVLDGTLGDSYLAILDPTGTLVGANDDYLDRGTSVASLYGNLLPAGSYWFLVREYTNDGGSFHLDVRPTIFYTDAVNNRHQLHLVGKAGQYMGALVAALQETPTPLVAPFPFMGNILLDFNPSIFLGIMQFPPSGRAVWPFDFSPYPIVLQGLTVDTINVPMIMGGRTTLVVH